MSAIPQTRYRAFFLHGVYSGMVSTYTKSTLYSSSGKQAQGFQRASRLWARVLSATVSAEGFRVACSASARHQLNGAPVPRDCVGGGAPA